LKPAGTFLKNFSKIGRSNHDDIVKSPVPVIASSPANGGATWQSRDFKNLQKLDRRASLAMTPFSDFLRVHQSCFGKKIKVAYQALKIFRML
jgi:hypothetical protein